jgi:mannose-1-phosphate guanylyltransferase
MKAMVLAAGLGTRLRPLTLEMPKVLLPVGGVPLIVHTLTWLRRHGISAAAVNLYHLGDKIRDLLGDGSAFGVEVIYSQEEKLLGTAGGVKKMESFFDDTFVVVYGDNLINFDLSEMIRFHREKASLCTLALFLSPSQEEVGVVQLDSDARVLSLVEKPQSATYDSAVWANGGVYVLEKEVLGYIPEQGFSDFAADIFPRLIRLGLPLYGFRLRPEDYIIDIGTPDKHEQANSFAASSRIRA